MDTPQQSTPRRRASGQSLQAQRPQSNQNLRPPKRPRSHVSLQDCCRTCRLRKVKCSGDQGDRKACSNCLRLELTCSFNDDDDDDSRNEPSSERTLSRTTPSRSHTEAGTLRKRAQRACTECHSHKTRCSGDYPKCNRCEASNLICEYVPAKRRFQHALPASKGRSNTHGSPGSSTMSEPTSPGNGGTNKSISLASALPDLASLAKEHVLANRDLLLKHIDAYFEHLYFTPCLGFLHKRTVYEEVEDGRLQAALAAGVCSVSAFFVSSGSGAVDFASRCAMEVEFHIFQTFGSLKELNLYLYAFDIVHNHMSGEYAKCWQLMAAAVRVMTGLQLNWVVPGSSRPFKDQECVRRLAWQIFHLDRVFAGGFDTYLCCPEDIMKISLPCPEEAFNAGKEVSVGNLQDNPMEVQSTLGLHANQVRLVNIRHHIRATSTKLMSGPVYLQRATWEASKVMEDIRKLQLELSSFNSSLPANLRLSDQNIIHWLHSPEQPAFVILHGQYCAAHIDLYRFSLPGLHERRTPDILKKLPRDFVLKSQKQAIAHAITLARFWESVYNEAHAISGGHAMLLGDYTFAESVQLCIDVLMMARRHNLYRDLSTHSTAPLWRNEPVDDGSIRILINACIQVVEPWSQVIPSVKPEFDELLKTVREFGRAISHDKGDAHVQPTTGDASHQFKFPGGRSILEPVHIPQGEGNDSAIYPATFERPYSATRQADYSHDPYTGLDAADRDWKSDGCSPGMPILLAKARGLPLERSPENPQTTISSEVSRGLGSPATGDMSRGNYQTVPSGQGSGLPIMTVGQIPTTTHTYSQPQGSYQQGLLSRRPK